MQSVKIEPLENNLIAYSAIPNNNNNNSKRARITFTKEQLQILEQEFQKEQHIGNIKKAYLANSLNLTEAQVITWFRNRKVRGQKEKGSVETVVNFHTDAEKIQ